MPGAKNERAHYREWVELVEPTFGRIYPSEDHINKRVQELMEQDYSIHRHVWTRAELQQMLDYAQKRLKLPFRVEMFCELSSEAMLVIRKTAAAETAVKAETAASPCCVAVGE